MKYSYVFCAPSAAGIGGPSIYKEIVSYIANTPEEKAEKLRLSKIAFAIKTGVNLDMIKVTERSAE